MQWHFDNNHITYFLKAFTHWAKRHTVISAVLLSAALLFSFTVSNLYFESPDNNRLEPARLDGNFFITSDNVSLPVRSWFPDHQQAKAIIVALHGFNDYSNFFTGPANYFMHFGIASYAYDQRGFGSAPERGSWAKIDEFTRDLAEFTTLIRQRHPRVPIYLLGESMGAAIIIVTMTGNRQPPVDGLILSAPAVWAWKFVPWYQRLGLWLANRAAPWLQLTGTSLHLVPSDNIKMLRALTRDPLVLKKTRISTIYGLADLMNQAFERANRLDKLTLVLYGERDEIVSKQSVYQVLYSLPPDRDWRVAIYENGYHLLLRDLQASKYWQDIATWINNPKQNLPSGADKRAATVFWSAGNL